MATFHKDGSTPLRPIFVFGSNEAGIHGAGAAKEAFEKWGAKSKIGFGLWGSSYAIPTKDHKIKTLSLNEIKEYVDIFLQDVVKHTDKFFFITRIGCGLAGYKDSDIAPMFKPIANLDNVSFAKEWEKYLK